MNPIRNAMGSTFYTHILQSQRGGRFYTGSTKDLRKRLGEHQRNITGYMRKRGPCRLVYYETCLDEKDARSRELYLKTGKGKRYLKSRLKPFLFRTG